MVFEIRVTLTNLMLLLDSKINRKTNSYAILISYFILEETNKITTLTKIILNDYIFEKLIRGIIHIKNVPQTLFDENIFVFLLAFD